jgi:hypothetical protein
MRRRVAQAPNCHVPHPRKPIVRTELGLRSTRRATVFVTAGTSSTATLSGGLATDNYEHAYHPSNAHRPWFKVKDAPRALWTVGFGHAHRLVDVNGPARRYHVRGASARPRFGWPTTKSSSGIKSGRGPGPPDGAAGASCRISTAAARCGVSTSAGARCAVPATAAARTGTNDRARPDCSAQPRAADLSGNHLRS